MRTLILAFTLVSSCAFAQSPLIKVLSEELDRNFTYLKQNGQPPPYFMGYEVSENDQDVIVASEGSIDQQSHGHARYLDVTIRVGSPAFDNYRVSQGQRPRFTAATPIALADDPDSIRRTVWLATDRVYRAASQRLIRLQADEKLRSAALDSSDDFSKEEAQVYANDPAQIKFDAAAWAARRRARSASPPRSLSIRGR